MNDLNKLKNQLLKLTLKYIENHIGICNQERQLLKQEIEFLMNAIKTIES